MNLPDLRHLRETLDQPGSTSGGCTARPRLPDANFCARPAKCTGEQDAAGRRATTGSTTSSDSESEPAPSRAQKRLDRADPGAHRTGDGSAEGEGEAGRRGEDGRTGEEEGEARSSTTTTARAEDEDAEGRERGRKEPCPYQSK